MVEGGLFPWAEGVCGGSLICSVPPRIVGVRQTEATGDRVRGKFKMTGMMEKGAERIMVNMRLQTTSF